MNTTELAQLAALLHRFHQEHHARFTDDEVNALGKVGVMVWQAAVSPDMPAKMFYKLVDELVATPSGADI
jgi:hypothetical protein